MNTNCHERQHADQEDLPVGPNKIPGPFYLVLVFHVARVVSNSLYRTPNGASMAAIWRSTQGRTVSPCQSQIARMEDGIACNFLPVSRSQLKDFFCAFKNTTFLNFRSVSHICPLPRRFSALKREYRIISQNLMNCVPCVTSLYLTYSPRSTAISLLAALLPSSSSLLRFFVLCYVLLQCCSATSSNKLPRCCTHFSTVRSWPSPSPLHL